MVFGQPALCALAGDGLHNARLGGLRNIDVQGLGLGQNVFGQGDIGGALGGVA